MFKMSIYSLKRVKILGVENDNLTFADVSSIQDCSFLSFIKKTQSILSKPILCKYYCFLLIFF